MCKDHKIFVRPPFFFDFIAFLNGNGKIAVLSFILVQACLLFLFLNRSFPQSQVTFLISQHARRVSMPWSGPQCPAPMHR